MLAFDCLFILMIMILECGVTSILLGLIEKKNYHSYNVLIIDYQKPKMDTPVAGIFLIVIRKWPSRDVSDIKVYFNNIYNCMLTINECDLIWKIMYGVIPTARFLCGCRYSDSPNCNYCGELDDLTNSYVTCSRLSGLFQLTQSLIRKLTPTIDKIPVWWYIIGITANAGLDVNVRCLCNWILAQAKIEIVYSRFNKYKSSGT